MQRSCQYDTQGFYMCKNKPILKKEQSCDTDNTGLAYRSADTHYDMNMKALLYQLRATPRGFDKLVQKENSEK